MIVKPFENDYLHIKVTIRMVFVMVLQTEEH